MAVEEMITSLPTVSAATMQDIIYAVQGYQSPSVLGVSVQETLQQVYNLFQSTIILYNSGNPNGVVAGNTYQLLWDTVDNILWVCTTSGTASTAVWTKSLFLTAGSGISISQSGATITISSTSVGANFVVVTTASQAMVSNTTYQSHYSGLVTFTLPTTSNLGDRVMVTGFGAGGWTITQGSGQQIIVGNQQSTVGAGGSVSSINQYDGIDLVCAVANTTWQTISGPQGSLTIV
jgi:hypothetical protein